MPPAVGHPGARRVPPRLRTALLRLGVFVAVGFLFLLVTIVAPVIGRRVAVAGQMEADIARRDAGAGAGVGSAPPPISWDLVLSDEQMANMTALREDVPMMSESSRDPFFLAWDVLPYPLMSADELNALLCSMHTEDPISSVYTDGQGERADIRLGRYRIVVDDGEATEDKEAERGAVATAVDEIASEIEEQMRRDDEDCGQFAVWGGEGALARRLGHGEDYLFATWAGVKVAQRCSYSDGVDDTAHANDIYGALIEGESKCYGMSCAIKAILDKRGIPSFVASGCVSGDDRHAVVILWVDGGWHVMDATGINREAIPDRVGWHRVNALMPSPWGCGYLPVLLSSHDFDGYLGSVVTELGAYEEAHEFVPDGNCVELMAAYERLALGCEADAMPADDIPAEVEKQQHIGIQRLDFDYHAKETTDA